MGQYLNDYLRKYVRILRYLDTGNQSFLLKAAKPDL